MMLKRPRLSALARILLVAAITCLLCCSHSPSLEERIEATASGLYPYTDKDTIPKIYQQEIVALWTRSDRADGVLRLLKTQYG